MNNEMTALLEQLKVWMDGKEHERLEFKEAKNSFEFEDLTKYCVALANEGGGHFILGVSDSRPRKVVGSRAFSDLDRTKAGLTERLRLRIEAEEIAHTNGRVVVFSIPSRPIGVALAYKGAFWMRSGEALVPMTPDMLKKIFAEAGPDFTAEICPGATFADLDLNAINKFRAMWSRKSGNKALESAPPEQLLADAELVIGGRCTYAALILFGTRQALGKYLAQTEVIFEYRANDASIRFQQREEYRQGFFLWEDDLWGKINLRNDVQHFQDGLVVWDIRTFNEAVVREAILNAVTHRDYRLAGSVFIKQFPRKLEIVSPGGFPPGITPENILWKQFPRNRRVAEAFSKCGLVERSGQGANRMFEECIKEGKPRPDFSGSDEYQVFVTLRGEIQDPQFLRFLEKIGQDRLASFTTEDLLILDLIHRDKPIGEDLKNRLAFLMEQGVIENIGRGRGTRYILSRHFYKFIGKKGVYTRKRGLDRGTNKALLLKHIEDNAKEGSRLQELLDVLPSVSRSMVQRLLRELRTEGKIHNIGTTNSTRWYVGPARGK